MIVSTTTTEKTDFDDEISNESLQNVSSMSSTTRNQDKPSIICKKSNNNQTRTIDDDTPTTQLSEWVPPTTTLQETLHLDELSIINDDNNNTNDIDIIELKENINNDFGILYIDILYTSYKYANQKQFLILSYGSQVYRTKLSCIKNQHQCWYQRCRFMIHENTKWPLFIQLYSENRRQSSRISTYTNPIRSNRSINTSTLVAYCCIYLDTFIRPRENYQNLWDIPQKKATKDQLLHPETTEQLYEGRIKYQRKLPSNWYRELYNEPHDNTESIIFNDNIKNNILTLASVWQPIRSLRISRSVWDDQQHVFYVNYDTINTDNKFITLDNLQNIINSFTEIPADALKIFNETISKYVEEVKGTTKKSQIDKNTHWWRYRPPAAVQSLGIGQNYIWHTLLNSGTYQNILQWNGSVREDFPATTTTATTNNTIDTIHIPAPVVTSIITKDTTIDSTTTDITNNENMLINHPSLYKENNVMYTNIEYADSKLKRLYIPYEIALNAQITLEDDVHKYTKIYRPKKYLYSLPHNDKCIEDSSSLITSTKRTKQENIFKKIINKASRTLELVSPSLTRAATVAYESPFVVIQHLQKLFYGDNVLDREINDTNNDSIRPIYGTLAAAVYGNLNIHTLNPLESMYCSKTINIIDSLVFLLCPICQCHLTYLLDPRERYCHVQFCIQSILVAHIDEFAMGGYISTYIAATNWGKDLSHKDTVLGTEQQQYVANQVEFLLVLNRDTGIVFQELVPSSIKRSMRMLYCSPITSHISLQVISSFSVLKKLTLRAGRLMDKPQSVSKIQPFIDLHHINMNDFEYDTTSDKPFKTFNDFFTRKLRANARIISSINDDTIQTSPADSRIVVFNDIREATALWIKGKAFTIENQLGEEALQFPQIKDEWSEWTQGGCQIVISRLAPQDYHRTHVPMDCIVGPTSDLRGGYLSVNPLAVRSSFDVFTTNRRLVTYLYNPKNGLKCFYIMVGATLVGSCVATAKEGEYLTKGSEFGYFCFGGSTVVLVYKPNTVIFDDDILRASKMSIEVQVKVGQSIAKVNTLKV